MMLTAQIESCWSKVAESPSLQDGWHTARLTSAKDMLPVIEAVVGIMAEWGYSQKDTFSVHLMLEESIVNAIKHGNQNDPCKQVEVRYRISQEHVLVEVEDEGPGFSVSLVPDATVPKNLHKPSGRGLLLIQHYANWVRFNHWGNCVTFCKCPSESLVGSPSNV
jgi:serine/threonine-protein kinase RsbW